MLLLSHNCFYILRTGGSLTGNVLREFSRFSPKVVRIQLVPEVFNPTLEHLPVDHLVNVIF